MIREAIEKAVNRINLSEGEIRAVFDEIMSGKATQSQIGSFLTALRMKGETIDEITGAAKVIREKSVHINAGEAVVDTCGTGGSNVNTFNISTTAAFVAAGSGLKVAKHGNRGSSSLCGSADVLEALGARLDMAPESVERCIREVGIGFMYAPIFHGAMKHASGPRKEIAVRTIFNILGPLSNPANASSQVLGVYDAALTEVMAGVLKNLGVKRAFVVHGLDGLDEITITGKTRITELTDGRIKTYEINPEKFGIKKASIEDIRGGDAKKNAEILLSILKGGPGPMRDITLVNSAAALVCGFKAKDFKDGIKLARDAIDSGKALDRLEKFIEFTKR